MAELQEGLISTSFVNRRMFLPFVSLQHNTMESLLERGEKLDDLVSKSEVLGTQSKAFYKTVSSGAGCSGHCSLGLSALLEPSGRSVTCGESGGGGPGPAAATGSSGAAIVEVGRGLFRPACGLGPQDPRRVGLLSSWFPLLMEQIGAQSSQRGPFVSTCLPATERPHYLDGAGAEFICPCTSAVLCAWKGPGRICESGAGGGSTQFSEVLLGIASPCAVL